MRATGHNHRAGRLRYRLAHGFRCHAEPLPAYNGLRAAAAKFAGSRATATKFASEYTFGDPKATGPAILQVVDTEEPPLRIFFGVGLLGMTRDEYAQRIATWEQWKLGPP